MCSIAGDEQRQRSQICPQQTSTLLGLSLVQTQTNPGPAYGVFLDPCDTRLPYLCFCRAVILTKNSGETLGGELTMLHACTLYVLLKSTRLQGSGQVFLKCVCSSPCLPVIGCAVLVLMKHPLRFGPAFHRPAALATMLELRHNGQNCSVDPECRCLENRTSAQENNCPYRALRPLRSCQSSCHSTRCHMGRVR